MAQFAGSTLRTLAELQSIGTVSFAGMPTHNGSAGAAVLSDSTRAFTAKILGATVYNLGDGSSGEITAFTATTLAATLTGGTNNNWSPGDQYIIIHPENGIFGAPNMQIEINDIVRPALSSMHISYKIEQEAISADQGDYPNDLIQSSSSQSARNVPESKIVHTYVSNFSDRRITFIRPNSNTVFGVQSITDGANQGGPTTLISSRAIERENVSSTGAEFAKVTLDMDQSQTRVFVNRIELETLRIDTTGSWDESLIDRFIVGDTGNSWGDFYLKDLELHDTFFDPVIDAAGVRRGSFRLAGFGDSFIQKMFQEAPANNITMTAFYIKQQFLKSGYDLEFFNHGQNGHGFIAPLSNELTINDINTMLADNPDFILTAPSVNDFNQGAPTLANSVPDFDTYKSILYPKLEAMGASSVRTIFIQPLTPFLLSAAQAGFGGNNPTANSHYDDSSIVTGMNAVWSGLKTDTALSQVLRDKLIFIEVDRALGADSQGKGYPREFTIGSATGTPLASDLHQSPQCMIAMGPILSTPILQAATGGSGGSRSNGSIADYIG